MSGRSPRWITKPRKTVGVTLAGSFHTSYAYATIDGTKYTSAGTVQGEAISVTVGGMSPYTSNCAVYLDGVKVLNGAGTYQYTETKDIAVVFTAHTEAVFGTNLTVYGTCEITTV